MNKLIMALIIAFAVLLPVCAQPVSTPQQVEINAQVAFGLGWQANTVLFNYQEGNQTTCQFQNSTTVRIAKNTTNNQINFATLFPGINTAVLYNVTDITAPGQQVNIGMASGGSRFNMNPNGFFMVRVTGSSPTLFIDNPSLTQDATLQVSCLAN